MEKLELKLERSVTVNKQIKIYRPKSLKKNEQDEEKSDFERFL